MGSTSAGAEQYYAEGSPKEHMNRREVGFIGLASERVRNGSMGRARQRSS